ncbi:2-dehydropantoate 2-reductase [archaeon]|nr:2-dehydropantoate 2-reductase [archaeon]
MKIMIFGAGALGSTLRGYLSKYHEVILIGRKKHVSAINKRGLEITSLCGKHAFRNMK